MIYNLIGLTLDLIGVILLFKFGILPDNLWEHILMDSGMSEKDEKKHKIWSKVAMGFLILGFVFQLLGSTMQHLDDKNVSYKEFENLNLGVDYNETTGIKGNLKVKFNENKVMYQLEIYGKVKSIDSLQKFTIELQDNDGFKISEIDVQNTAENTELSNLIKADSVFLKVKGAKTLSAKNYLEIKKWELLAMKNNLDE
jgi:hypothetical protein